MEEIKKENMKLRELCEKLLKNQVDSDYTIDKSIKNKSTKSSKNIIV